MGKSSRKRQREEDREDRERLWKRMGQIEDLLLKIVSPPPPPPPSDYNRDSGTQSASPSKTDKENLFLSEDQTTSASLESITSQSVNAVTVPSAESTEDNNREKASAVDDSKTEMPKEKVLDETTLKILGEDPSIPEKDGVEIHPQLVPRWNKWLAEGLKKEEKEQLLALYPKAKNCYVEGQILNEPVHEIMNASARKRDEYSRASQDLMGSALIAIGSATSLILDETEAGIDGDLILKHLVDAGKLLSEVHHQEAISRRAFIIPGIDKDMKPVLENSKMDKFLFGEKLEEKINSKKSVVKVASDLKIKPQKSTSKTQNHLNSKAPPSNSQDLKEGFSRRFSTQKFKRHQSASKSALDHKLPSQGHQKQLHNKNQPRR